MTKIYAIYATRMTCVSDPRRTFSASSHLSLPSSIHSLWSESFATELPFLLSLLGTHSLNIIPRSHDDDNDEKGFSCCWDSDCLVAGYTAPCIPPRMKSSMRRMNRVVLSTHWKEFSSLPKVCLTELIMIEGKRVDGVMMRYLFVIFSSHSIDRVILNKNLQNSYCTE